MPFPGSTPQWPGGRNSVALPLCPLRWSSVVPARGGDPPSRVGRARPLRSRTLARHVSQPQQQTAWRALIQPSSRHVMPHMPFGHKTAQSNSGPGLRNAEPTNHVLFWCAAPRLSARRAAPRLSARRVLCDRCSCIPAATRAVAQDYTAGPPSQRRLARGPRATPLPGRFAHACPEWRDSSHTRRTVRLRCSLIPRQRRSKTGESPTLRTSY